MKIILKIARAELRNLFYSPVAWVVIVVFFVITGIQFVGPLMDYARVQEAKLENSPSWEGFKGPLTLLMFDATIGSVLSYFYLFIPLLTMGSIGKELSSGTMNLLSSSPVRIREIIAGKYLGLIFFNLILLSSILLLLLTGYFSIEYAELKWYLSMMLGFFLLSSAYMAIGLYISCLTSYQLLAGLASFVVFFLLSVAGSMFQDYDLVRDITYFLGMAGRADAMVAGLITSRDFIYFVLIIILFLGLSVIRLKKRQESKKWTVSFTRNFALITVILTLGYFSSRPGHVSYLDVTRDKRNTIDSTTQAVLRELDGSPVTVTLYSNLLGGNIQYGVPKARNVYIWQFWDMYTRFYPNIKFKYEYYYDIKDGDSSFYKMFPKKDKRQIAERFANMMKQDLDMFKRPEEISKVVDLSKEQLMLIMELEYKGKKSKLRTFDMRPWPAEENVSAAIRGLTRPRLPNVLFTTGHYERSPWRNGEREYGKHTNFTSLTNTLINQGFITDTISLLHNDIPDSTDILVIADPRSALDIIEQQKILQYISKGGNALFYAEPGKQQMLNPMLYRLGVTIDPGIIVQPGRNKLPDEMFGVMNKAGNYMAAENHMQIYQLKGKEGASASFNGTSTISYTEKDAFKVEPVVFAYKQGQTWIENGVYVRDSAAPVFSANEGDVQKDEYNVAVKLSRTVNKKEQRIVVTADADFMAARELRGQGIGNGFYSWLVNNEYPVYTKLIIPADKKLTIGKNTGEMIWYIYVYVLPGLLLVGGTILLIRRKRK